VEAKLCVLIRSFVHMFVIVMSLFCFQNLC